jgi:hypothetical protein
MSEFCGNVRQLGWYSLQAGFHSPSRGNVPLVCLQMYQRAPGWLIFLKQSSKCGGSIWNLWRGLFLECCNNGLSGVCKHIIYKVQILKDVMRSPVGWTESSWWDRVRLGWFVHMDVEIYIIICNYYYNYLL